MNRAPHAISLDATLADAQQMMRAHALQQLPVLAEEGALAGILLERDLLLALHLGADFTAGSLRMLHLHDAFSVTPDESLASVVRAMASRAADYVAVTEDAKVVGVLTASNALRILADMLEAEQGVSAHDASCAATDESCLISQVEETARKLLSSDAELTKEDGLQQLRAALKELYEERVARVEAEARELVCVRDAPSKRRQLEQRHGTHKLQAQLLEGVLMGIDDLAQPVAALAVSAQRAVASLRADTNSVESPRAPAS